MGEPAAGGGRGARRVLFLSWRDLGNPLGGGAERYLHRLATGLAARGDVVSVRTARLSRRGGPRARRRRPLPAVRQRRHRLPDNPQRSRHRPAGPARRGGGLPERDPVLQPRGHPLPGGGARPPRPPRAVAGGGRAGGGPRRLVVGVQGRAAASTAAAATWRSRRPPGASSSSSACRPTGSPSCTTASTSRHRNERDARTRRPWSCSAGWSRTSRWSTRSRCSPGWSRPGRR